MKLSIRLASLVALSTLALGVSPAFSNPNSYYEYQSEETTVISNNIALNRAKNLARQAAESLNGGLGRYRAEPSMHGTSAESPFADNGNGSWTFSFKGYRPGTSVYSVETVVTVFQDGRVRVDYNGSIRQLSQF